MDVFIESGLMPTTFVQRLKMILSITKKRNMINWCTILQIIGLMPNYLKNIVHFADLLKKLPAHHIK
ncbi:MAG: hypothetical protein CL914_06800 [Deltaproteobacteria bacterium]|jgi:hypothetical protein|nr:hypothetical protein [Deltaproteobacteria bacterium]MBP44154.1 hypothetical protein [Deltaproteobacteria bacterium]